MLKLSLLWPYWASKCEVLILNHKIFAFLHTVKAFFNHKITDADQISDRIFTNKPKGNREKERAYHKFENYHKMQWDSKSIKEGFATCKPSLAPISIQLPSSTFDSCVFLRIQLILWMIQSYHAISRLYPVLYWRKRF